MADSQLGLGGFVAGVELQDLLEVSPCQVKVVHCQVGLSSAEKAFLIVAVQFQSLMTREEEEDRVGTSRQRFVTASHKLRETRSIWPEEKEDELCPSQ